MHEATDFQWMDVTGNPVRNWISDFKKMNTVFTASNGFCVKHTINATNISQADLFNFGFYNMWTEYNDTMQVIIADTNSSPNYKLNSQTLKGEAFGFENGIEKYYSISFEEIHRQEESGGCTNYGEGAEFKTYADCVSHEQDQIFKPILGGCMVPWLAAPGSPEICKGKVQLNRKVWKLLSTKLSDFWGRVRMSGSAHTDTCLKSCIELQAHSTLTTTRE